MTTRVRHNFLLEDVKARVTTTAYYTGGHQQPQQVLYISQLNSQSRLELVTSHSAVRRYFEVISFISEEIRRRNTRSCSRRDHWDHNVCL